MDLLTQGIAGSLLAQLGAPENSRRHATIAGFIAGVLPDADALIRSSTDPLLTLEFHRQFSHSLIFIPLGAAIAWLLLWPFMRHKVHPGWLYFFCVAGFASAGLLDACTSYGTQLLWPFSDERIAWNLVAIIDPVFTLVLVTMLLAGWRSRKSIYPAFALAFAVAYLLLAFSQHRAAEQIQQEIAASRGHTIERSVVKPTLGNIILWRSIYQHKGDFYVDALRPAIFSDTKIYPGKSIEKYRPDTRINELAGAMQQYADILRFARLSDGYLVIHPKDEQVLGDVRYSMLPNSIMPLWGIRLNPDNYHQHAGEALFRDSSKNIRQQFIRMVRGQEL